MKEQKTQQAAPEKAKIRQDLSQLAQEQFAPPIPLAVGVKALPPDMRRRHVLHLQRTVGNRAAQRWIIQRGPTDTADPNPLPVFMPWTAGAMAPIQVARMRAETLLVETFDGQIKTVNADAGMKVTQLDEDALKTEYAKKAAEKDGKTSAADIQEYVNNKHKIYPGRLDGFAFQSQNVVYVNKAEDEDSKVVILAHEMLHMNAAGNWAATVRADIDEGTTEYLTQKACARIKSAKKAYAAQIGIVQKLIAAVGEGTLVSAYFGGGDILRNAVDTLIGKGTFNTLLDRINDPAVVGTFDDKIGKLLDPRKATWLRQKIDEMKGLLGGWVSDDDINRIRQIRSTIDQPDMTQVREELYPLVNSLWSDRQKGMMIDILS
jgi:hypothetical protein